ncbi:L-lactate permease [Mycobacterium sp. DSM 3803]|uniref:L-lactate permease n=1 Tax=Mycolicibacterium sp. TaxID=2320850 RepID=UPI0037C57784|nr:L-lactate permease [Mycobacterium sp. DSM 3803]
MTQFQQILDPAAGSLALSALIAAVPLTSLFVMLGILKWPAHRSALVSLATSIVIAVAVWQMPVGQAASATLEGALYGVFPILWILINAIWLYRLTEVTGWFAVLGEKIRSISDDQRVQAILIAFCFGALLESLAGFGAPVAISAAMLMAAGMKPVKAAVVSLLANTAPVAFGAMAAPIITLSSVTGLDLHTLSQMAGRQTPFVAMFVPFILVFLVDGRRGLRETWAVCLVAGVTFGLAQFVTSNFIAVEITDVVAAVVTVAAVLTAVRVGKPASGTMSGETVAPEVDPVQPAGGAAQQVTTAARTKRSTLGALAPYLIIIAVFSVSQLPAVKPWLAAHGTWTFHWPGLDVIDATGKPLSAQTFKLDHLKATGTLLLLSGLIVMGLYRISPREALRVYRDTVVSLRFTIVTVTSVLALAFVMNLSGQTQSLGFALASAGGLFALLSPLIGWIGVAITGSDTSSNSLFGLLQATAASHAGLSQVLMAATNSSAGVMGKMLSPQNLAVAAAAVGMVGREGEIFRKLIWWSLGMLTVFTVFVYLQSTVLSWMVP